MFIYIDFDVFFMVWGFYRWIVIYVNFEFFVLRWYVNENFMIFIKCWVDNFFCVVGCK